MYILDINFSLISLTRKYSNIYLVWVTGRNRLYYDPVRIDGGSVTYSVLYIQLDFYSLALFFPIGPRRSTGKL